MEFDPQYQTSKEHFAITYAWIEWYTYNDNYTAIADTSTARAIMTMYSDDYFKNHTWVWDKKPHWAYNTKYMNLVPDRKAIEWTPNTIASTVVIEGTTARVELKSNTPNLKTCQMKELPEGDWKDVSEVVSIHLKNDKNMLAFRTVNIAGGSRT